MSLNFIDIVQTGTDEEHPRGSSLLETDEGLQVVGNLPHNYTFKMKSPRAASKLVKWIEEQWGTKPPEPFPADSQDPDSLTNWLETYREWYDTERNPEL